MCVRRNLFQFNSLTKDDGPQTAVGCLWSVVKFHDKLPHR